jgi:pyruvate formate lyase activating enzyme
MSDSQIELPIGGWTPFTTIDYPGHLAAVIYCQGCPWRCSYCHNGKLRPFVPGEISWADVRKKLEARQGWIEAVVFSGGEPTAHPQLTTAMDDVHSLGFKVGLHTAGIYPAGLEKVLPHVDWVGMDVKAPFGPKYEAITGVKASEHLAFESLLILIASKKPFQLRTTMDPDHLTAADLLEIDRVLDGWGVPPTVNQRMRTAEEVGRKFEL